MISRFASFLVAFLMGVPLCWCSYAQPPASMTAEVSACSACHPSTQQGSAAHGSPHSPHEGKSHACCHASVAERNLSPDTAAAPRLVLVDLQAWVRMHPESFHWAGALAVAERNHTDANRKLRGQEPPLYQRHCALLL